MAPSTRKLRTAVHVCAAALVVALGFECTSSLRGSPEPGPHSAAAPPREPQPSAAASPASPKASAAPSAAPPMVGAAIPDELPGGEAPALHPVLTDELVRLRRAAERKVLGHDCPPDAGPLFYEAPTLLAAEQEHPREPGVLAREAPSEKESTRGVAPPTASGHFVPVENEAALAHFQLELARLARDRDHGKKVRILFYGASHTQADIYPEYLRDYLQSRFGDGGQGFVLLGRVNRWYRTLDTNVRHRRFSIRHARYRIGVKDEPLGLFGAAFVSKSGDAFGEITTSHNSPNTEFELQYLEQPGGGDLLLELDGKELGRIPTKAPARRMGYYPFETTPGHHTIRVQPHGNGAVRVFGVVAETKSPGVVVDTLGISGARMDSLLTWDEAIWTDAIRHRHPALVAFAYGTNELTNPSYSLPSYERQVRRVLERLRRALPDVSCLLISPFDVPKRKDGHWVHRPTVLEVVDAQRRISAEFGCGFWDGYTFMGGDNSMARWVMSNPQLASRDHVHLTRVGYVYAGAALGDALLRAYDAVHGAEAGPATAASAP